jgi:L-asparagine transporter-like permease
MKVLNYLTPNEMFQHLYSVAIASWIHQFGIVKICEVDLKKAETLL